LKIISSIKNGLQNPSIHFARILILKMKRSN